MKRCLGILVLIVAGCAPTTPSPIARSSSAEPITTPSLSAEPDSVATCEPTNEAIRVEKISLRIVNAYGAVSGFAGIVGSGTVISELCDATELTPLDFALSDPTGAVKCGDVKYSPALAAAFSGSPFPIVLEAGQRMPIVVGFAGEFVSNDTLFMYGDVTRRHCRAP